MPDKLFLTTGIPACLFILSKNRDGEHRQEVMFIDARKLGQLASRLRVFHEEEKRGMCEGLNEKRLALFDQLPKPKLTKADRERIKYSSQRPAGCPERKQRQVPAMARQRNLSGRCPNFYLRLSLGCSKRLTRILYTGRNRRKV